MNPRSNRGADLHVHTTCSDGTLTPEELVAAAREKRLEVIAITDHDTVAGIKPALRAAAVDGPEVVAGVELSAYVGDGGSEEIHIVGLFVNPDHRELLQSMERYRRLRRERAVKIVEKLNRNGIPLRPEDVYSQAGAGAVSRLHVARALVKAGHVRSITAAFDKWLSPRGAAFVSRTRPAVADAISLIHRAGGVAVLAHPASLGKDDDVPRLVEDGLDAIEVHWCEQTPLEERHYLDLAAQHGLLVSGGSDCHGNAKEGNALGEVRLDRQTVHALRARAVQISEGRRNG